MMNGMEPALIVGLLALLGLMLGSFAGAQVWRLRARQLAEDLRAGEPVDKKEYDRLLPLTKATVSSDRSRCLHCGTVLVWHDLLPLLSWLRTGGKCRYCKKPIGIFEPLMEIGMASAFVLSYLLWPFSFEGTIATAMFLLWLVSIVLLGILFAYDLKWFLLPDVIMFPLIGVGLVVSVLRIASAVDTVSVLISLGGAILILSGLYYFLWYISKGQWVGFGDVKLGLGLALLLGDWRLALLTLFLANLIGTLVVLPGMVLGKIGRGAHVPFGPLLIAGMFIAMLIGEHIIALYLSAAF